MATIDDRNGQQTAQQFNLKSNKINNLLESIETAQLKYERGNKELQASLETQREIEEKLASLNQRANDAMLGKIKISKEEEATLEANIVAQNESLAILKKSIRNTKESIMKAQNAVRVAKEEVNTIAEENNLVVDALIRRMEGQPDTEAFAKLDEKLNLLEIKKRNLEASIEEIRASLVDDSIADKSVKLEMEALLKEKQAELIDTIYDLNIQSNVITQAKGGKGKKAENLIEEAFGKEFGGALNFLGGKIGVVGNILDYVSGKEGENIFSAVHTAAVEADKQGEEYDSSDALFDVAEQAVAGLAPEFLPIVEGAKEIKAVLDSIMGIVTSINNKMGEYINKAAESIKSYYGRMSAGLYGYATYKDIADLVDSTLGGNTLIKQTDYLSRIAELSAQGIARDVESAALLETIRDKTLLQFDASNESLRRLIRLGNEQVYQSQFGLELQLKKVLNSTFKDSGYLSGLFDSVRDAIMDAAVSQTGDITAFSSIVQTWMGAMYSTGLSSQVVNQIASGINALGSGNVTALAGDEATQRLFLLAMDRVGLDYADILQQGLSLDDTNKLMTSIVDYLDEIATNTSDNLVLKSSYSGLFNMSMTDIQAIHNLASQTGNIASNAVNTANAIATTENAITNMVSANTSVAEKWDNFFENFQYAMGANIAESSGLYNTWRVSSIVEDLASSVTKNAYLSKTALGAVAKGAGVVAGLVKGAMSVGTIIAEIGNLHPVAGSESMLLQLLNTGGDSSSISNIVATASGNTFSRTSLKNSSMFTNVSKNVSEVESQAAGWSDDSDVVNKVLGEIEKTIMKLEKGDGYAFAVSLEGMNNNVLQSFASIFADENAMLETFQGDNKVITDALFSYLGDSSSTTTDNKAKA